MQNVAVDMLARPSRAVVVARAGMGACWIALVEARREFGHGSRHPLVTFFASDRSCCGQLLILAGSLRSG